MIETIQTKKWHPVLRWLLMHVIPYRQIMIKSAIPYDDIQQRLEQSTKVDPAYNFFTSFTRYKTEESLPFQGSIEGSTFSFRRFRSNAGYLIEGKIEDGATQRIVHLTVRTNWRQILNIVVAVIVWGSLYIFIETRSGADWVSAADDFLFAILIFTVLSLVTGFNRFVKRTLLKLLPLLETDQFYQVWPK